MPNSHHVFDFLAAPEKYKRAQATVVFGDEPFLKRLVIQALRRPAVGSAAADDGDWAFSSFDCNESPPEWRDLRDELSSHSLFGGGSRLIVLEQADDFVSLHRGELEDYVSQSHSTGVLLLEVTTWPANTKLYKLVDESGLQIDCRPPQAAFKGGKTKELDEKAITRWIIGWGKSQHGLAVANDAAQLMLELTGPVFGLLDSDLAKLALFVQKGEKVTAQLVQEIVGGWRSQTAFEMVDAAVSGNAAEALVQLDRLMQAGEHPLALLGAVGWSLRRYAAATRLYQQAQRGGQSPQLKDVLRKAGVFERKPGDLDKAQTSLKQLGRHRAGKLYGWLLDTELSLKGSHSALPRARFALEQLFLRLAEVRP